MKIFPVVLLLIISILILIWQVSNLNNRLEILSRDLSTLTSSHELLQSYVDQKTNRLQDSLEERIGTLERDTDDIKFLLGNK